jgi:hypothetical protein
VKKSDKEKAMSHETLKNPVELTDDQLDFVAAGARQSGLVNVAVEDSLNDVNIGVAAQALTANSGQVFRQI